MVVVVVGAAERVVGTVNDGGRVGSGRERGGGGGSEESR